jgi:hypothetical protein
MGRFTENLRAVGTGLGKVGSGPVVEVPMSEIND